MILFYNKSRSEQDNDKIIIIYIILIKKRKRKYMLKIITIFYLFINTSSFIPHKKYLLKMSLIKELSKSIIVVSKFWYWRIKYTLKISLTVAIPNIVKFHIFSLRYFVFDW